MGGIVVQHLKTTEVEKLLSMQESHFLDFKSIGISPSKLTRTISAFSNAEGGEIYIGIYEDKSLNKFIWQGFTKIEDANGFIQTFEEIFPLGNEYMYTFLEANDTQGFLLKVEVKKTRDIKLSSEKTIYVRRGAQNLPLQSEENINRLRRNKGLISFENENISINKEIITNSTQIIEFMLEIIPTSEPEDWLRKQQLLIGDNVTVAGLILFADEPQAALPKRCGLKIYRYKTKDKEGTRESLDFDPISIEGSAYNQIFEARKKITEIIQAVRIKTPSGLKNVIYPNEALHEIITNAVIHRDYSIADDIHVRIYDNRIEVLSPGTLPAHITPENILSERFSRNGAIVRLINKFKNPPNKDIG
jgi:ATP-dependent DNA helicase RecG